MILYRCATTVPMDVIHPSNWAMHSIALEVFLDMCEENCMAGAGDKIIVIEIPTPQDCLVGSYARIHQRQAGAPSNLPFGKDDKSGWWSFNLPYSGPYQVVAVLKREDYTLEQIDYLDHNFKADPQDWAPWLYKQYLNRTQIIV